MVAPTQAQIDGYKRQLIGLLPRGPAFDGLPSTSWLARVLEAAAKELATVELLSLDVLADLDPRTASGSLGDWERVLGLPDDRVLVIPATTAGRRTVITAKYTGAVEGQNYSFFYALCAACGRQLVSITLYADEVFRVGDRVGHRVYGAEFAFSMLLTLAPPATGAMAQADFERVIRRAAHAHITVGFAYT